MRGSRLQLRPTTRVISKVSMAGRPWRGAANWCAPPAQPACLHRLRSALACPIPMSRRSASNCCTAGRAVWSSIPLWMAMAPAVGALSAVRFRGSNRPGTKQPMHTGSITTCSPERKQRALPSAGASPASVALRRALQLHFRILWHNPLEGVSDCRCQGSDLSWDFKLDAARPGMGQYLCLSGAWLLGRACHYGSYLRRRVVYGAISRPSEQASVLLNVLLPQTALPLSPAPAILPAGKLALSSPTPS